MVRRLDMR